MVDADEVRLVPIDEHNVRQVFDLQVAPGQERFVAANAWSLAQALAESSIAWPRAIMTGDTVVGFLMLGIDHDRQDAPPFWLWRLMIGAAFQLRGYGRAAVRLACDEVRRQGGVVLMTSWIPADDGPEPFYLGLGFVPTGELDEGEVVGRLAV